MEEIEDNPGYYSAKFFLRPHYQLEGLTVSPAPGVEAAFAEAKRRVLMVLKSGRDSAAWLIHQPHHRERKMKTKRFYLASLLAVVCSLSAAPPAFAEQTTRQHLTSDDVNLPGSDFFRFYRSADKQEKEKSADLFAGRAGRDGRKKLVPIQPATNRHSAGVCVRIL